MRRRPRARPRSCFPKHWDPRSRRSRPRSRTLRGLDFEHPGPIRYLAPKDFEKQIGDTDQPSADDRAEIQREEAVFRALGFIGGKVDLLPAFDTSESSSTLAFYDPNRRKIFVRGTTLDVEHRVTVAHELTHVLQDQHFDLQKLQKRAAIPTTGDSGHCRRWSRATRCGSRPATSSSSRRADQKEYDREDDAEGNRVGKETTSVPASSSCCEGAPYEFGPSTIRVLDASGGNAAVDAALDRADPRRRASSSARRCRARGSR